MPERENISCETLDQQLLKIADGDKSALAAIYDCVSVSVYSYALSILKNRMDAEDVLQDTLLEIWRAAPSYKSMGKPMAWIITIARSLCLMNLRRRSKISDEPAEDFDFADKGDGLTSEDRIVIRECMQSLGDEEREIVILHAVAGLKHRETASILDIPLSTVLSKYNRAIKKLRKRLSAD